MPRGICTNKSCHFAKEKKVQVVSKDSPFECSRCTKALSKLAWGVCTNKLGCKLGKANKRQEVLASTFLCKECGIRLSESKPPPKKIPKQTFALTHAVRQGQYAKRLMRPNETFGTEGCGPCVGLLIKYKKPNEVFCAHIDHCGESYEVSSVQQREPDANGLAASDLKQILPLPHIINKVFCTASAPEHITRLTIECLEKIYGQENVTRFESDNIFIRQGQIESKAGFASITSRRTTWVRDGYLHLAVNPLEKVHLSTDDEVSPRFLTADLTRVVSQGHWGVMGLRPGILFGTQGCVSSVGLIVLQTNRSAFCAHIDHNIEPDIVRPGDRANKQSLRTSLQLNLPPPHHVKKFGVVTLTVKPISELIVELIKDIYKNKEYVGHDVGKYIFITGKGEIKSGRVCDLGTEQAEEKDAGEIHVIQGEEGLMVTD